MAKCTIFSIHLATKYFLYVAKSIHFILHLATYKTHLLIKSWQFKQAIRSNNLVNLRQKMFVFYSTISSNKCVK